MKIIDRGRVYEFDDQIAETPNILLRPTFVNVGDGNNDRNFTFCTMCISIFQQSYLTMTNYSMGTKPVPLRILQNMRHCDLAARIQTYKSCDW